MNFANALWLAPNFWRKDCTSSLVWMRWPSTTDHVRDARLELCSISPASCMLAKSSPKFFLFMPVCLRNLPHCLFLFLRQILSLLVEMAAITVVFPVNSTELPRIVRALGEQFQLQGEMMTSGRTFSTASATAFTSNRVDAPPHSSFSSIARHRSQWHCIGPVLPSFWLMPK